VAGFASSRGSPLVVVDVAASVPVAARTHTAKPRSVLSIAGQGIITWRTRARAVVASAHAENLAHGGFAQMPEAESRTSIAYSSVVSRRPPMQGSAPSDLDVERSKE